MNPPRPAPRKRSARFQYALAAAVLACSETPGSTVTVVVGPDPNQTARFSPKSSLAEYLEIPGSRNELRIVLAEHDASCDEYVRPPDGQTVVTVVVTTPPDARPEAGDYPWLGLDAESEHPSWALPKAQIGRKTFLPQPGGHLKLTETKLEPHGTVAGLLSFKFPGSGEHPASRLEGSFEAKLCRFSPAPTR